MQIITDSGKVHWAIGKHLTCPQCETVFCLEAKEDFRRYSHNVNMIGVTCPKEGCSYFFHHNKPVAFKPFEPLRGGVVTTPWITPNVPKITFTNRRPDINTGVGNTLSDVMNKLNNARARAPTSD